MGPPMGTRGTLLRAGDSYGAGDTRRKGRSPKETVCPLFSSYKPVEAMRNFNKSYQPIEAVKKKGKNILPLFQRASSGLFSAQACVSKTLGHVNKVKAKRELVKLVKGPSFDKISKVQDSLKSVPGYEEIFQLVPRASHENGDPEVGVCEQVKGGQSLGSIGVIFLNWLRLILVLLLVWVPKISIKGIGISSPSFVIFLK